MIQIIPILILLIMILILIILILILLILILIIPILILLILILIILILILLILILIILILILLILIPNQQLNNQILKKRKCEDINTEIDLDGSPIEKGSDNTPNEEESDDSLEIPRIISKWSKSNVMIKKLSNFNLNGKYQLIQLLKVILK